MLLPIRHFLRRRNPLSRINSSFSISTMATAYATPWGKIPITRGQLCLATVLRCGQSFRWKTSGNEEWSCGFKDRIISLRQDSSHLHYRAHFSLKEAAGAKGALEDTEQIVKDYLNLSVDLESLYEKWSKADGNFKAKAGEFSGVRMLRQPPFECLISFICSSNNNISRIGQMVDKLGSNYGKSLGSIEHTTIAAPASAADSDSADEKKSQPETVTYYSFPEPEALTAPSVESALRTLGFGYRAKYIYKTACTIANERPPGWLEGLRDKSTFREAHDALLELSGVGPKVADCVCLMCLDKCEAVPVDTHVWQIAQRDYKFSKSKHKSLTTITYNAIGDHFRALWGNEAGWAHSVLFTADLRSFSDRLESTKKTTTKVKVEVVQKKIKEEEALSDPETAAETEVKPTTKTTTTTTTTKASRKRNATGQAKVETTEEISIVEEQTTTDRRSRRRRG